MSFPTVEDEIHDLSVLHTIYSLYMHIYIFVYVYIYINISIYTWNHIRILDVTLHLMSTLKGLANPVFVQEK